MFSESDKQAFFAIEGFILQLSTRQKRDLTAKRL
jgi:hypothetical protein